MSTSPRTHSLVMSICATVPLLLAGLGASVRGDTPAGWLSVKDCGASGSKYETTASTTAGSKEITVKEVGDFKVGQSVTVSKCNPQYTRQKLRPPENAWAAKPLEGQLEMRGYDGSQSSWSVFIVEVDGLDPLTFRYSDDLAVTWKKTRVPVTNDWQPLSGGTQIKFNKFDWKPGHMVTFSARDQLLTRIEKIEGNKFTLADPATRTVKDAVVRHTDTAALQAAISRAIREKRNLFIPVGHYRLSKSLSVHKPDGLRIEGASATNTVLDISEGDGAAIRLSDGAEATIRHLSIVGHTGLGEGPGWRSFRTSGGGSYWSVGLKPCQAVAIRNTTRVLIEDVHASKMNCEAFYCQGRSRQGTKPEPKQYTKAITYLRCSATNCDGNAFNNNDMAENTSVMYCRIVDVAGCSWEGASRFVKIIGNYFRNSGPIAMGNIGSRAEHFEVLGSGQHIVANNVFEGRTFYWRRAGGFAIRAAYGANQVIIKNNLFINYNSSGVEFLGAADNRHLPAESGTISGNIFDMTNQDEESLVRTAIHVSMSHAVVSNNQIYTRGACDPQVTAIKLTEPALNLDVHDNLVRNCASGIVTARSWSRIGEVIDATTFVPDLNRVPMARRRSHLYKGWKLVWQVGNDAGQVSTIGSFDPETCRFTLTEAHKMKPGDRFEVFPPCGANWNIHDNTITACTQPVVLDSYGSNTSMLRNNLITRGRATGVKQAIAVSGRFGLIGNQVSGFDEKDSAALLLNPSRLGEACPNIYRDNIFQRCSKVMAESKPGLWEAATTDGNVFIDCDGTPGAKKKAG